MVQFKGIINIHFEHFLKGKIAHLISVQYIGPDEIPVFPIITSVCIFIVVVILTLLVVVPCCVIKKHSQRKNKKGQAVEKITEKYQTSSVSMEQNPCYGVL